MGLTPLVLALSVLGAGGLPDDWVARGITCNSRTGLSHPPPLCAPDDKCTDLFPSYAIYGTSEVTEEQHEATCARGFGFLGKDDGPPKEINVPTDFAPGGVRKRKYCLYEPRGTRLPLVIWFHGSSGSAGNVYDITGLRDKAETWRLDDGNEGFLLATPQSLNRHWPPRVIGESGAKHDYIYRDWEKNEDFRFVDRMIDELVASGKADPNRIFVTGWSNGCIFSMAYGIVRYTTPTPAGNRVAAIAGFSGVDPFTAVGIDIGCILAEYPKPNPPLMLVSKDCDVIPCFLVETWVAWLRSSGGEENTNFLLINSNGDQVSECAGLTSCDPATALVNHLAWPSSREDEMLQWLKAHPLDATAPGPGPGPSPTTTGG
uniref:Phospholipase/carboxylesterase/thioesterase domain-containing protein n=1 Tax=Chromera velia CCMP2878 TaxID=1169474 RepID=A0A0G4GFR8_9ALVE|eukprot:Cvel_21694.t1-p1 / transcript=Cvel_21694.t1 / gene=Cvel_21694 / organism=Chromera_velia_CCMP2878 / gene_product=hypothetical protein / transcript_product=hypothetical protein / location=Cvel_scaffold2057:6201-7319(-) / protein_length=373 / sequence_SO=supercontig / SO=protein_coding / is_pseudo=false